ncbi:restriction endonuclease subunit S [Aeromonas caviae]|uniref:restriction endonuclease subunit S n=1 Tax=Aeromonas caviae TaxID=648 RepID=UPI0009BB1C1D|nr:restriction endonuclease subunit S [Aeromonas caviae]
MNVSKKTNHDLNGWGQCELGDVIAFQRGFDLPQRLRVDGDIPIVSSSGVSGRHNTAMVAPPGIVTGRYGTIGEIFYIDRPFWPLNTTLYVRHFNGMTPEYAYHFLRTIDFNSHSGKSGVPGVNRNDVHKEIISFPRSIQEQTAIANVLSDSDALIAGLVQLIAKKQAIKTATMQQLLTGRTRLPQFALRPDGTPKGYKSSELGQIPEDWGCYEIGSFTPFITSGSRGWAEFYAEHGDPFVRITNTKRNSIYLDLSDTKYVDLKGSLSEANRTALALGDVLISITADIGICAYIDERLQLPAYINQHIALVRFNTSLIDSKFVSYFLASEPVQKLFRSASDQGAKAGMNLDSVRKIKIIVPTQEEQTAIATILSDIDSELTALEQKLTKARALKQGMMQQLLTGRIRLPLLKEA